MRWWPSPCKDTQAEHIMKGMLILNIWVSSSRGPAGSAKEALHAKGHGCSYLRRDMLLRDTVVAPSAPMHNSCQQLAAQIFEAAPF